VANLRNLALSLDGTRLLAITDTTVVDLIPASLVAQATMTLTAVSDPFLKGIVATNDGQAFITSSSSSPIPGQHFLYNVALHTFTGPFNSYSFPETGGPDNGTRAAIVQGGLTLAVQQYSASTGLVSATPLLLAHSHPVAGRVENIATATACSSPASTAAPSTRSTTRTSRSSAACLRAISSAARP
jgi:hypothetical protein